MDPSPLHRLYVEARNEGVAALATFLGLCTAYADRARHAIRAALDGPQAGRDRRDPGPLLYTAREAAPLLGPSWSAKKLYRVRHTMPAECYVRKGGRLYFVLPTLKEWAAKQ